MTIHFPRLPRRGRIIGMSKRSVAVPSPHELLYSSLVFPLKNQCTQYKGFIYLGLHVFQPCSICKDTTGAWPYLLLFLLSSPAPFGISLWTSYGLNPRPFFCRSRQIWPVACLLPSFSSLHIVFQPLPFSSRFHPVFFFFRRQKVMPGVRGDLSSVVRVRGWPDHGPRVR